METSEIFIVVSFIVGLIAALVYAYKVDGQTGERTPITSEPVSDEKIRSLNEIAGAIEEGANAFLIAEYKYIALFMGIFMLLIGALLPHYSWHTAFAFIWGGATSLLCGYIGMRVAVKANVRVTHEALKGWSPAFLTAFEGGCVLGFSLVSIGLMNLFILIHIMQRIIPSDTEGMYEAVAGYGLGGSTMALFGRVGGGIYTKAADVGADLVGKVEAGIPEDHPCNPGTIADNVGDNVGDIAGMGSDLFGSFAESTCAALVIAASIKVEGGDTLGADPAARWFPLIITAAGILVCLVTSFLCQVWRVEQEEHIELQLKAQLVVSTVLATPVIYFLATSFLPPSFRVAEIESSPLKVFCCVAAGLWAGLLIGLVTEYYTSHSYAPVREVADSCSTGAATNVIFGVALGYKSCIIPVLSLAVCIWTGYQLASQYGIAMAALGMLCTLCIGLTIDAYGPISDNAGGIAEMADLGAGIRDITDALDAAGNTTAAIGKGFAIGSAALVSLALFGAFTVRADICKTKCDVNVMQPLVFAGLIVGAMLPYWFSAMTMKSVGIAAQDMVKEIRDQFANIPMLREKAMDTTNDPRFKDVRPDYQRCVAISTTASLREMIPPGILVIFSPIIVGFLFGKYCLAGLLCGSLVSGVQIAISMSNTGGAWDNAKKYIEKGAGGLGGKGSEAHKAAVVGDTIGDPMKDTSGPSNNILMKLMAITSLIFAGFFDEHGGVLLRLAGASIK